MVNKVGVVRIASEGVVKIVGVVRTYERGVVRAK